MGTNTIHNIDYLSRPVDFSGLPKVGRCSPTYIDFALELTERRTVVFGEFKRDNSKLTIGQRILLEQTTKAYARLLYRAAAFLAWHPSDVDVVDAANARIVSYFNGGWWERYDGNVGEFIEYFFGRGI